MVIVWHEMKNESFYTRFKRGNGARKCEVASLITPVLLLSKCIFFTKKWKLRRNTQELGVFIYAQKNKRNKTKPKYRSALPDRSDQFLGKLRLVKRTTVTFINVV